MGKPTDNHQRPLTRETEPLLVSESEAARLLGVSVRTIQKLLRAGRLSARYIGRRTLLPRAEVADFAARDSWDGRR